MNKQKIKFAIATSLVFNLVAVIVFVAMEPEVTNAVEDTFQISQSITSEISFATPAGDVTMNGSIAGITGGISYGTSTVIVYTNNAAGYTMTIAASSSPAMQGNSQGGTIADYTPANPSIPDYTFSVPSGAEFGFSVSASTTSDLAQKFLDNGSNTCNTGSSDTGGSASCWHALSTVSTSTIVRATATPASGATTSIYFKLKVNSGSSVLQDTYTATTTLTATTN